MTKGELVRKALTQIGIADYEFDIDAEELSSGVDELDAMMGEWAAKGVGLSYAYSGDSGTESGIPRTAELAVYTNLAVNLASSYGKQPDSQLLSRANKALRTVYGYSARPMKMQFPTMPRGAGYKDVERPFSAPPTERSLDFVDNEVDTSGGPENG